MHESYMTKQSKIDVPKNNINYDTQLMTLSKLWNLNRMQLIS